MGEEPKEVVTRPHDVIRVTGSLQQPVDMKPSIVNPADRPFFVLSPDLKPAEAAKAVWEAYQDDPSCNGQIGYAHCIRLETRDELTPPSLQLFTTDVRLGKITDEGFLRPLINPNLTFDENLRRLKDGIRELQRYERNGVLHIKGFYGPGAEIRQ